jgi:hypothetical protein
MEGPTNLVRVQASSARPGEKSCPQHVAAKAHVGVWAREPQPRKEPGLQQFALDPVTVLLDMMEFDGLTLGQALARLRDTGGPPSHAGLLRWAEHAVGKYLAAGKAIDAARGWAAVPVSRAWVMQSQPPGATGGMTYELCAWGRRYESGDGRRRELRVPRAKSIMDRPVELAEIAVDAFVLAYGRPALGRPRRGDAYQLGRPTQVGNVRVVEVGCEDASHRVMFDGTAAEAKRLYGDHARQRLRSAVTGGEYRPGDGCPDCKLLGACPALPRRPGILGIDDASRAVRSWSVTNGRHYQACHAQEYLGRLHLPPTDGIEHGSAVRRGQAVHAWLAERHARKPASCCTADDVPATPDSWSAGGWQVSGGDARLGVQMIGDHALMCALRDLPPDAAVFPEHQLTVYDPDAGVVVIAKTDLLYQDGSGWVLRETKTTTYIDEGDLLVRYPQVALGVVLLGEGIPGGSRDCNRVELERLTPAGPLLEIFDPADPDLNAAARRVVHQMAADWHADTCAEPDPGKACRTCEVWRWCPDALTGTPGEDADDT